MTGNSVDEYKFDFEKEVNRLISRLGKRRTRGLSFVDLSATPPRTSGAKSTVRLYNVMGDPELTDESAYFAREIFTTLPDHGSTHFPIQVGGTAIGHSILLRRNDDFAKTFGDKNKDLMRLYMLYHEAGHALLDNPDVPQGIEREASADAHAALCLLQRFGGEVLPLLSMISWQRSLLGSFGDTSHCTTTVIDKIIADSTQRDCSTLTSAQIIALAGDYARRWAPDEAALAGVWQSFPAGIKHLPPDRIEAGSFAPGATDLAFYLGAKIVQPPLRPEGMVLNGNVIQLTEEKRSLITDAIAARARDMTLSGIFNREAEPGEPSATETLQVALPHRQQRLRCSLRLGGG